MYLPVNLQKNKIFVPSPMNYTGGKHKLLPQLLPLFPSQIKTMVDLFCGGLNVGLNVPAERVIYNDNERNLLYLYGTFKNLPENVIFEWIYEIIDKYGLSLSSRDGYDFYGCDSNSGLGAYNSERFLRLRDDFNSIENVDYYYYVILYVIIVYAFNNQMRFNRQGKFNLPVGKRDFNAKMESKLKQFLARLKSQNCVFSCRDFREFDTAMLKSSDFVYADPPYLITCASYNENGGWNETAERDLLAFLDKLDGAGIKFALSNVISGKGKTNEILAGWAKKNEGRYIVHHLKHSYANSNYQRKNRALDSDEVLIVNYREGNENGYKKLF